MSRACGSTRTSGNTRPGKGEVGSRQENRTELPRSTELLPTTLLDPPHCARCGRELLPQYTFPCIRCGSIFHLHCRHKHQCAGHVTSCHAASSDDDKMEVEGFQTSTVEPAVEPEKEAKTRKASEAFRDECAAELDKIAAEAHENEMNAYAFAFQ